MIVELFKVEPYLPPEYIAVKWDGSTALLGTLQKMLPNRVRGYVAKDGYIDFAYRMIGNTYISYSVSVGDWLVFSTTKTAVDERQFGALTVVSAKEMNLAYSSDPFGYINPHGKVKAWEQETQPNT